MSKLVTSWTSSVTGLDLKINIQGKNFLRHRMEVCNRFCNQKMIEKYTQSGYVELNKSYFGDDFRMLVTFYYSLLESSPMKVCQTCIDWRKFSEIDTDNKDK